MILNKLVEFADSINDELPPSMYSKLGFKWEIELDEDGNYIGITPLSNGKSGKGGLEIITPNRVRSGINPPPLLLGDKANYVLGYGYDDPNNSPEFRDFANLVNECAEKTGEPKVRAVQTFLDNFSKSPDIFLDNIKADLAKIGGEIAANDFICFRVGGIRPIDLPSVRAFWADYLPEGPCMQCLVCGQKRKVNEVHPKIKHLNFEGERSSDKVLISANKPAFTSYGAKQALIAPICRSCCEAYVNAINYMLTNENHHIFVGPTAFLFWTKRQSNFSPATLLSRPNENDVKTLIAAYRSGVLPSELDGDDFYALTLSASISRAVVRDWLDTTIPAVQANLGRWFSLQKVVDNNGSEGEFYGVDALARSLYPERKNTRDRPKMAPNVPVCLVRCALTGGQLPNWLLAQAIGRNRAEQGVTRNRIALIKAVILSQKTYEEGYMEDLDRSCTSPGYVCGRLLAELEAAQKVAINPKATIVDRYYGAASSAPASIFGNLMRISRTHLSKLSKEKPGIFVRIDRNIQEILSNLKEFPKVLSLKEQAMFALGYYHQKSARWAKVNEMSNEVGDEFNETNNDVNDEFVEENQ